MKDLEAAGDLPTKRMNLLQRIFAWIFGASAAAQAFQGDSVVDSVNGMRNLIEPVQGIVEWVAGNQWLIIAAFCIGVIVLVRLIRNEHVEAYRNFDYQGPARAKEGAQ